jgi:hypothetical protein
LIDANFINKIVEISDAKVLEIDGRQYTTKQVSAVKKPLPDELGIASLTGIADYINGDLDGVKDNVIIWVGSPCTVAVISKLETTWQTRKRYMSASAFVPGISYGQFMDLERFNIMLQSMFVNDYDREKVLKVVGNVKDEQVQAYSDDGVSQQVTAKTGVAKVEDIKVPNPVVLAPYRTFSEVEQPCSAFVFRMQTGGRAALFEADGGAWRAEATASISTWLSEHIKDVPIIS